MRRLRRSPGDDGAAMILVLVIVVLIALVSTAFLTKSSTELKSASRLQTKVNLQYGVDAALEQGVAALSAELTSLTRTSCVTPFEPAKTIATFTWTAAAFPTTATCQDLQGYTSDSSLGSLFGAAIITTGGAGSLQTQSAVNTPLDIGGSVYVSGTETSGDLKKQITLTKGDLAVQGCTDPLLVAEVTMSAPYKQYCTALTPAQVAPTVTLPALPITAPAPYTVPGNKCRIFFPGKYTTSPALLSGGSTSNYFASGNYYFDGSLTISAGNNVEVVAGAPSLGDVAPVGVTACATDAQAKLQAGTAAGSITSTGAAFFMGGSSSITVAQGTIVMNSRPVTLGYDIPLSVYAIRSGDTGWDPWSGGSTPVIGNTNPNATMLFNGTINAYSAPVSLFASNPTFAVARAGIVASTLTLQASASGAGLDVSGYGSATTAGFRIVKLTAHAAGTAADSGTADGVAIVRFNNDLTRPVVLSWRLT